MKIFFVALGISLWISFPSRAQGDLTDDKNVRELILAKIKQQGIDNDPVVENAMQVAQDAVLFRAWTLRVLKEYPVTPSLKNSLYKEQLEVAGDFEYKIYHLFLIEEKTAQRLIQKMKEIKDWSNLDPKNIIESDVKYSFNRTDWINLSAVMPDFRQAVRGLQKGSFTEKAIRSTDGWHVVGVVDVRPFKLPPPESLDKELNALAERVILDHHIKSLLSDSNKK